MSRIQITLDQALYRRAKARAQDLGCSFSEYVKRLIETDLGAPRPRPAISEVFGIGSSGGSDVAQNKDAYLAEALEADRRC